MASSSECGSENKSSKANLMNRNYNFILVFCVSIFTLSSYSQAENYYSIDKGIVLKKKFEDVRHELIFESQQTTPDEALTMGWGSLAAKFIPMLVDGASKLFYNPDNFNKEYFANHSFFDASSGFKKLDINSTMVFEHMGKNADAQQELISRFEFEMGDVKNVDGYKYIGLKAYDINYSWAKLSSSNHRISYVLDIGFYYFDEADKAQEFHLNPILLHSRIIGDAAEIDQPNFQAIPKMKALQTVQIRVREVNDKKQNWDKYLELYQSNQADISMFLIKAISK